MFEYDPEVKAAAEVLDKYDLGSIFKNLGPVDIYDLSEIIIDELREPEVEDAIDVMSADEIQDYLVNRYKMRISEVIHTFVEWVE